jgi:hydroxyacylglutathione hydrolase
MFQRYYDAGLAQASYLLACPRTREAVVIDPRRDIDVYVAAARQQQLKLAAAIETHVHADFVSGARELAAIGAQVVVGPGSSLGYEAREAEHDERISFGDLTLRFLHTPGHTLEHLCILAAQPGEPERVFTGDTLFVGAVGRPDLLGPALTRGLAEQLHHSLFHVLLALDDSVEVHPGHGAGSLCGTGIGAEPHSTIGRERASNPMLKYTARDEFASAVLGDLPETPQYFTRMKRLNQAGPPLLNLAEGCRAVDAMTPDGAADALTREAAVLVDLRPSAEFCAAHPPGAINIAFGPSVGYWAGWLLPGDSRVVLFGAAQRDANEVRRQLMRVGIDHVLGLVEGGIDGWRKSGHATRSITQLDPRGLHDLVARGESIRIIDVRTPHEWRQSHIEGSIHLPVGDISARAGELPHDVLLTTICEGGYRSSLAASLLARAGFPRVANVAGGMAAYRAAVGLPCS